MNEPVISIRRPLVRKNAHRPARERWPVNVTLPLTHDEMLAREEIQRQIDTWRAKEKPIA